MADFRHPFISVIITTLNEEDAILPLLQSLRSEERIEKIVVDGGSADETTERARKSADKVLTAFGGRARQLNAGAAEASGDIFWFLHADSGLPSGGLKAIRECLADPAVGGGAFRLKIDSPRPALRLIGAAANLRTRLTGVPYGDQGLFVRRTFFQKLGGFPDFPLMEDLEFSRRMKKAGRLKLLPETIRTSPRRWDREGVWFTTLRNQVLVLLYFMGVSPARLVRWYQPVR